MTSAGGQSHCIEGQGIAEISLTNGEIKTIRDVQYVPGAISQYSISRKDCQSRTHGLV
jgi:hypothetical protein